MKKQLLIIGLLMSSVSVHSVDGLQVPEWHEIQDPYRKGNLFFYAKKYNHNPDLNYEEILDNYRSESRNGNPDSISFMEGYMRGFEEEWKKMDRDAGQVNIYLNGDNRPAAISHASLKDKLEKGDLALIESNEQGQLSVMRGNNIEGFILKNELPVDMQHHIQ